jgi:hypothetical protein
LASSNRVRRTVVNGFPRGQSRNSAENQSLWQLGVEFLRIS